MTLQMKLTRLEVRTRGNKETEKEINYRTRVKEERRVDVLYSPANKRIRRTESDSMKQKEFKANSMRKTLKKKVSGLSVIF